MRIPNPEERLSSLWGLIDAQHNGLIASRLAGTRVLDIGCGYGSLVHHLTARGFQAEGWDRDPASIAAARRLFPSAAVRLVDAEHRQEDSASSFDSVVLKDVLHHLVGEGDVRQSFATIRRVLRPGGRIVILDPNPTWILRLARKAVAHSDPEVRSAVAIRLLDEEGFDLKGVDFHETIGLPLSGGYVGVRLVPNWQPLNRVVAAANHLLSRTVARIGLGPTVSWRYVIHADARRKAADSAS